MTTEYQFQVVCSGIKESGPIKGLRVDKSCGFNTRQRCNQYINKLHESGEYSELRYYIVEKFETE